MSPRRTRAKNATTHPGAVVLAAQGKRRTKMEKAVDDDRTAAEKAAAERAKQEQVIAIAKMVMELREKEQNVIPGPKASSMDTDLSSSSNRMTAREENMMLALGGPPTNPKNSVATTMALPSSTKLKKTKMSLKEKINEAERIITSDTPVASRGSEANSSQYVPKPSFTNTVKGWAAHVHEKTSESSESLKTSWDTTTLASNSSKNQSGRPTKSTLKATTSYLGADTDITTKFGGFDADWIDGNDDGQEEQVVTTREKGKGRLNVTSISPSAPDSDSEIEASQIPPWYNDDYSCTPPPSQPRVLSSAIKRKIEEVPDSEDEDEPNTSIRMTASTLVSVFHTGDVLNAQPVIKKVKTESDDTATCAGTKFKTTTMGAEFKPRSEYKNSDLPVPADQKWTNIFLGTVILWAGGQSNIWSIPDETLAIVLQEIFSVVYPDIQYMVTIQSAVFGVVSQRLLEWRSGFGSTALAMVIHFFWRILGKDKTKSESSRMELMQDTARHLIAPPHFRFTHEDTTNLNPMRNFRSKFVLELIGRVHLSKTLTAADVPSLGTASLVKGYGMESVIALASVALERAFTLIRDGIINVFRAVEEMAEKKGKFTLPKMLNKSTGNMSKCKSMFSVSNWGKETQAYAAAVIKKGPENTTDIIQSIYALLDDGPAHHSSSDDHCDADVIDPRSLLWYLLSKPSGDCTD